MRHESMVRNLAAQAECIWPQEAPLLQQRELPRDARILDVGCGTGEITERIAHLLPGATALGVDIVEEHLAVARSRCAALGPRVRFERRDAFDLGLPDASFDLATCRHVLQAVPEPQRLLAEMARVTAPGGWLHLIVEDYGMIHFPPRRLDPDDFWRDGPVAFGAATGTDLRVGRRAVTLLRDLGLREISLDYIVVDTLRVPRDRFAAIWEAWRDGYADAIGRHSRLSAEEARAHFDDMIATLRDESAYAAWLLPVIAARVP